MNYIFYNDIDSRVYNSSIICITLLKPTERMVFAPKLRYQKWVKIISHIYWLKPILIFGRLNVVRLNDVCFSVL